jgi:hypothetical protein
MPWKCIGETPACSGMVTGRGRYKVCLACRTYAKVRDSKVCTHGGHQGARMLKTSRFMKSRHSADGFSHVCKDCRARYMSKFGENIPDAALADPNPPSDEQIAARRQVLTLMRDLDFGTPRRSTRFE